MNTKYTWSQLSSAKKSLINKHSNVRLKLNLVNYTIQLLYFASVTIFKYRPTIQFRVDISVNYPQLHWNSTLLYDCQVFKHFRQLFASAKSIQASVTILEHLECLLEKTPRDEIKTEVLPLLYNAFDSSTIQIQVSGESIEILFGLFVAILSSSIIGRDPLMCTFYYVRDNLSV